LQQARGKTPLACNGGRGGKKEGFLKRRRRKIALRGKERRESSGEETEAGRRWGSPSRKGWSSIKDCGKKEAALDKARKRGVSEEGDGGGGELKSQGSFLKREREGKESRSGGKIQKKRRGLGGKKKGRGNTSRRGKGREESKDY